MKHPAVKTALLVGLFVAVAFMIRAILPYDYVFSSVGVRYTSADAYYHMRVVDNLVHNFPFHMTVDPYAVHPGETGSVTVGFFIWLIAIPAWLLGGSAEIIDKVGVFVPAVLGALTIIPVYFIGKEIFGKWAGLLSAGLLAILPGEFLGRSMLGFTDYHIVETLLSSLTVLFLILALKAHNPGKRTVWSILSGLTMGLYVFTWSGAPMLAFIVAVFFGIQFIYSYVKGKDLLPLFKTGVLYYGIALIIALSVSADSINLTSLAGGLIGVVLCYVFAIGHLKVPPVKKYYPFTLIAGIFIAVLIFYLVSPDQFDSAVRAFGVFSTSGTQLTTIEMQPLISSSYGNPYAVVWGNYNMSFFIGLIGLLILVVQFLRKCDPEPGRILIIIWSIVILLATLGQRRFGYYLAVNIALLTGYVSYLVLKWGTGKMFKVIKDKAKKASSEERYASVALGVISMLIVLTGVYLPNVAFPAAGDTKPPVVSVTTGARYAPTETWITTLGWIEQNTPEPFENPEDYYKLYDENVKADYGIMAWWDYGYWITRIGHRVPVVNPSQNAEAITKVAKYLTSTDEDAVKDIPTELDARYLILDPDVALGKYWAILTWAGVDTKDYMDVYYIPDGDGYYAAQLYSENYYKSLLVRLYAFEGKGSPAKNIVVIGYDIKTDPEGQSYNFVTSAEKFETYEEAVSYRDSHQAGNYKIVSEEPFQSPVPVDPVENCSYMFKSIGQIKVFEFVGDE